MSNFVLYKLARCLDHNKNHKLHNVNTESDDNHTESFSIITRLLISLSLVIARLLHLIIAQQSQQIVRKRYIKFADLIYIDYTFIVNYIPIV